MALSHNHRKENGPEWLKSLKSHITELRSLNTRERKQSRNKEKLSLWLCSLFMLYVFIVG